MEVSIIIVNYNVKKLILDCINSVYTYLKCVSFEIIVIDNNSTDESIEVISRAFPEVKIIQNQINAGFSEANNQGIEAAKGKYILLLNPDTYLIDSSLCGLISFTKEKGSEVLCAPKLLNSDRTLQHSAWKDKNLIVLFQESFRYFNSAYPAETYTLPQQVDNVSGAAMFFSKELVEKIGCLDSTIFWMEDFDFCYRARKAGMPVYYYPSASVVHMGGQSSETNLNVMYSNLLLSKLKFYKKHYSKFEIFPAFLFTFLHLVGYTLFLILIAPFSKNHRKKISPYFYTFGKFTTYLFRGKVSLT
jgi:GT2 family glycosyltransferase